MKNTIEINGRNRIVLNGTVLTWTIASDVQRLGLVSDTLEDKFEQYCEIRKHFQIENAQRKRSGQEQLDINKELHQYILENTVETDGQTICDDSGTKRKHKSTKGCILHTDLEAIKIDDLTHEKFYEIFKDYLQYHVNKIYEHNKDIYINDCKEDLYNEAYIEVQSMLDKRLRQLARHTNIVKMSEIKTCIHYTFLTLRSKHIKSCLKSLVYVPDCMYSRAHRVYKAVQSIYEKHSEYSTKELMAKLINNSGLTEIMLDGLIKIEYCTSNNRISQYFNYDSSYIELDATDVDVYDEVGCVKEFDKAEHESIIKDVIYSGIHRLTEREKDVLNLRFGLDIYGDGQCDEPRTLGDTGKALGVTQERVRQIEAKAIRKLRRACREWRTYIVDIDQGVFDSANNEIYRAINTEDSLENI